jgi:hypothetical protein
MKKKIVFIAPKNEWGTYFFYKDITSWLFNTKEYEVIFVNSFFWWLKYHFIQTDIIFSIIPFLFKPIWTKKYFFNLHWNYKLERKNKWLWVKLLYLSELNLWFSDKIILTSYYLSDKLSFTKKYSNKIEILPNFVKDIETKSKLSKENDLNFLTITSFKFFNKWKWIINLWNVIKRVWEKYSDKIINFTIVWNENNEIFIKIKKDFAKISFTNNVKIHFRWWLNKIELEKELLTHNTFLYWTELDNYPWTVLDAINYDLKVLVNNFESFKYFLDENIICKNEDEMFHKILKKDYKNETKIYNIKDILEKIKLIIN